MMSAAETLITEHLDTWSSAIRAKSSAGRGGGKKQEFYGIKKLRALILELAGGGGLVHNDPDEAPIPYSSQQSHRSINNTNPPENWRTILLSDGIENRSGNTKLIKGRLHSEPAANLYQGFSASGADVWCEDFEHEGDAIIISAVGARCGKAFKAAGKWSAIANTNITWPNSEFFAIDFAYLVLNNEQFWMRGGSAQPFVKFPPSLKRYFSVPPIAEQHRIVAKVDELMALCDQLEQKQEGSARTHGILVQTLLGALTVASERGQFEQAWQRIESNFDTLFTTESSIDQLKQTILQLAVMGRLVPQNSSDEPAPELLKKITAEKAKLAKAGLLKKQSGSAPITDREEPYPLPHSWCWCRLGDTGIGSTGSTPKTSNVDSFGGQIQFIGPGQITPTGQFLESDKTLTENGMEESTEALPGDILMVCIGGSIGKSAVADRRFAFNQQINSIRPIHFSSQFLNTALSTDRFYKSVIENSTGSATPIINRSKWEDLAVPVPPLAEQHRIVARVDELMTFCESVKVSLKTTQATQLNLADSLVEAAIH